MTTTTTLKATKAAETAEAVETLKRFVADANGKVFVKVESVSKSGMTRKMVVYTFTEYNGELIARTITHAVAKACDLPLVYGYRDTVKVNGCGMDMIWWLSERIGHVTGIDVKHESL